MQNDPTDGGADKRAFARLPLRLDARLVGEEWEERRGQIRDFCPGGVFLACERSASDPPQAELAADAGRGRTQLRFRAPGDAGVDSVYTVLTRVVRSFEAGLGLAFIGLDLSALSALEGLARRQSGETAAQTGGNPSIGGASREEIVAECQALSASELSGVLAGFFKRAESELLVSAREPRAAFHNRGILMRSTPSKRNRRWFRLSSKSLLPRTFPTLDARLPRWKPRWIHPTFRA